MQQRLPSLVDPPIMFANRGARAHAPENTLDAFRLALRLGATGLASEVSVTEDGTPVLAHDGRVRSGRFRRRPIPELRRAELPREVPTLTDLLDIGGEWSLSLELLDPAAGAAVVRTIADRVPHLVERTWLRHGSLDVLADLRAIDRRVRLVHAAHLERLADGPERHAARLTTLGVDGVSLPQGDWTGGLTVLFHRFERAAFATHVQHEHHLRPAFRMGLDAVYSDHVDRMVDAFVAELGGHSTG